MNKQVWALSFGLLFGVFSNTAVAYELATHGAITNEAHKRSILMDGEFLKQLGINLQTKPEEPFGSIYYDVSGADVKTRESNSFEDTIIKRLGAQPLSIAGWLLRGAIREDDAYGEDNPQDDRDPANATLRRPLHHFFDPANNRPLTVTGIGLLDSDIHTAPAWGLGTTNANAFTQPHAPEAGRRNHFTIFDVREAMYRALTGRKQNGSEDSHAQTKAGRDKYWATTFRALGDVVHLIQDMGQPQHTRNDQHAGKFPQTLTGHTSVYEKYIEARATGAQSHTVDGQTITPAPLDYLGSTTASPDGYSLPRFTRYSDYWSTSPGSDQTPGLGLADYSNRGFFTAGTNLGANAYRLPDNNAAAYTPESAQGLLPHLPRERIHFLRGGPDNIRMTTEGLFDFWLVNTPPSYSLNRFNYDAQANLLIPRAVAYSAGLIDYFFRGRIEAEDAHFADHGIALKLRNTLDPDLQPEWRDESLHAQTRSGDPSTLTVTYEYKDEQNVTRHVTSNPIPLVTDPNNSANDDNIAPGETSRNVYSFTMEVPFVDPARPRIYQDLQYRLVYRGRLGNEDDAVVATTFRPVSGFLVTPNNYVPADGISGPRMIFRTSTGWKLAPDSGLVAGNIDWKGRYEADPADPTGTTKPTKVLSWVGPKMRYFPDYETCRSAPFNRCQWLSRSDFSRAIFENGKVLANAPGDVLGAAITKDLAGKDWLVAICMMGAEDVVYRRPYRNGSDSPYDPVNAPNGWEKIGHFDASSLNQGASRTTHHADIPWFFSGDGKKAQTMRRWWETTSNDFLQKEMRLEINITDDIALVLPPQNHGNLGGYEGIYTCGTNYDQYGAGTGQSTASSSGEYIIAVDYDDGNEVLAKIRVTGNSTKTTTVKVAHNHEPDEGHSKDVVTGTTQLSGTPYKEDLLWKDGKVIATFSDGRTDNVSWGTGPEPSNNYYKRSIDRATHQKEISYLVDLRYNLYSYYFVNVHSREDIAGGVINYAENADEGNEIVSDLMSSKISLYSHAWPPYTSSTSPYRIERELNCGSVPSPFITRRYGLSNFGWFLQSPGSGMVDSRGNYAISHPSAADYGYETLAPTNLLTDGKLEDVIKNAPPNAFYYPISVLR
ncbi:MAG: hypothetical protein WD823_08775 [Sulfuricaulis sp.]|uniref:hypothetical protein n=1 Tax=Sulfuricaulis sp. TaxID=2003553 RepID=UPI0034A0DAFC